MSQERTVTQKSGFLGLAMLAGLLLAAIACFYMAAQTEREPKPSWVFAGLGVVTLMLFTLPGFFIVSPNDSKVLLLFGKYVGTVKANGFYWTNPFTQKKAVSLRARNLNGEKLKVNDHAGNPIEIAAVVVWQVRDTFAAEFEVDHYVEYVHTQSESAVRKLASAYDYDGDEEATTLRGSTDEVNDNLRDELETRFARAGVHVVEARISHLAYAPEIAHAMLQRQQAQAVVAARTQIVEGAVGMVEMALAKLAERNVVELDDERRATMVSNLLVVLCSERTTPVINAGSLYS